MFTLKMLSFAITPLLALGLTAMAFIVHNRSIELSLPIPLLLSAFAMALPLLSWFLTHLASTSLDRNPQFSMNLFATFALQLIVETMVATVALTHMIPPPELRCELETRWRALYSSKDVSAIRTIQDSFNCCGLNSVRDMAWPFKGSSGELGNCVDMFHRTESCFNSWRHEEQMNALWLFLIALTVFMIKVLTLTAIVNNVTWSNNWLIRQLNGCFETQPPIESPPNEESRPILRGRVIERGITADDDDYRDTGVFHQDSDSDNDIERASILGRHGLYMYKDAWVR